MRLYTCQPRFVYDILCKEGRFFPRPQEAGDEWFFADAPREQAAYEWLCREMERRNLARPAPDTYPVWAWHQYDGVARPKPDLRRLRYESRDERQVMLTLDVPDAELILHDFTAWHYPLNGSYIGTRRATADFERRCKVAGFALYAGTPLGHPALREELELSWQAIFDIKGIRRMMGVTASTQTVQATFWELRADQVIGAVEYGQRRPRQKLPLPSRATR